MWADAHAARRCRSHTRDLLRKPFSLAQGSSKLSPFAAALELPTLFSKSKSNAQSRLRQQVAEGDSDGRERQARVGSTYLLRLCDALLRAFSPRLRGARVCSSHEQDRRACNSVFFYHMFKANCKHPPTSTHTARFAEFALSLTQQYLLKFRRKMKTHLRTHTRCFS